MIFYFDTFLELNIFMYMQFRNMVKKAKGIVGGEESKRDNVKWTESMDLVLVDALLEQQLNGNRCDGTFTTTAYNNVLKFC